MAVRLFMNLLFDMVKFDDNIGVAGPDPVSNALCKEHRAMLASGTAERDHEVTEMTFQIVVDALPDDALHML